MTRLIALVLLAVATCGQAADTVLYYGPDGAALVPGKYWRVTVGWQNGQPVVAQTVLFEVGGVVPPGPPQPPINDMDAKVAALLAAVTDAAKAETQAKLAKGYAATVGFADGGTITDVGALKTIQQMVDKQLLAAMKKTDAWKPWTDGMTALVATTDFAGTLAVYKIAQAKLGGTAPVPPPQPPPGPTTAVKALILLETGNQTPAQAQLLNSLRNDPAWSKLVEKVDPQQKTESNQPDPLAQAAVKACGSQPLPRLLLLDAAGSVVGDSLPLPGTFEALKAALTEKGVKP